MTDNGPRTTDTISRARAGDEHAFRELTDPYRRELQLHCYRILGSLQDAEDLLQETLLAAWRGLDQFEGRSSLRAWLYRIATNRCLNALRDTEPPRTRARATTCRRPTRVGESLWLEPYPDALLEGVADVAPGPEARYETKEAVALAFVAGLQHLPPRQRAVLVLRDVLGFRAAEVADMLDISEASVNSALQRARATPRRAPARRAASARRCRGRRRERELLSRVRRGVRGRRHRRTSCGLLTDDALLTMPPQPLEYQGHEAIAAFLADRFATHTRPARAADADARQRAAGVRPLHRRPARADRPLLRRCIVLTLEGDRISAITRFGDSGILPLFGLPRMLRD